MNDTQIAVVNQDNQLSQSPGFGCERAFELIQREAKMFAGSGLVPSHFQGNIANCVIGLEIAHRLGASPLAVMQSLYIVHGKPSWSSQFIIAAVNSTGRFSPLRFDVTGEGDAKTCTAWATEKATGERLESPSVSIAMAKAEGWFSKNGSKWQTMPDLMLRYRAATFFGRLYAPEILMGMRTQDEVIDIESEIVPETTPAQISGGSKYGTGVIKLNKEKTEVVSNEPLPVEAKQPEELTDEKRKDVTKKICNLIKSRNLDPDTLGNALRKVGRLPEKSSINKIDELLDTDLIFAHGAFERVAAYMTEVSK